VGTVERLNCEETEECFPLLGFHDLDGRLELLSLPSFKASRESSMANLGTMPAF